MSEIKVLLWDIDGTLLNFLEAQKAAMRSCFAKFSLGPLTDAMIAEYSEINHAYWQRLERGELTKIEVLEGRFYTFFRMHGLSTECVPQFNEEYQVRLGDTVCFYPGALETVLAMKEAGIRQYAVTNGTKKAQIIKLAKSGLREIFDGVFISEDVGYEKPNIEFFQQVFSVLEEQGVRVQKENILIIGDSVTSDMQGGFNAGIRTCWFRLPENEGHPTQQPDYVIREIPEVKKIVLN